MRVLLVKDLKHLIIKLLIKKIIGVLHALTMDIYRDMELFMKEIWNLIQIKIFFLEKIG